MSEPTPTLRDLFDQALALAAGERAAWLDAHCADAAQRAALARLLATDAAAEARLLDVPFGDLLGRLGEPEPTEPPSGARIGPFTLLDKLGAGGSSIVYRAEREQAGVRQTVALKLLRRGLYAADEQRRFRDERRALAQLRHPGIAHLIEGGVTDAGVPYIALELIDGAPITVHARERGLDLRQRLALMVATCRAVDAAHRALIVHRDLKPSNVLVTREGTVKLLDFGIAKLLDPEPDALATHTEHRAMTPGYAAPEQFSGGQITTATDVYALGVLLGELLTGHRREPADLHTPSSQVAAEALPGALPAPADKTRRLLRGDLDNIVLKATAEEPARRYASAAALADDIERHLADQPVLAHPPSARYRIGKFVARHRGGVASTLAFALAIFAALGVALWQARIARQEAQRANSVRDFVESLFDPVRKGVREGKLPTLRELVAAGSDRLKANTVLGPAERVDLTLMFSDLTDSVGDRAGANELAASAERLASAALAKSDPLAIAALSKRGALAIRSGDYASGEPALLDAEQRLRVAGIGGMPLVGVLDNLAVIQMERDHAEAALALERRALDERIHSLGADAPETAAGYNNLGYGLEGAGQFDAAADAYEHAWRIDLKYRQPDSYDVLAGLSNWGWTLVRAGHVQRARELLAKAQADLDKLGGKPRYVNMLNAQKLCGADTVLADVATAARSCAHMLDVTAQVAGQADAAYGDSLRMETMRLIATGQLPQARAMIQRSWALYPDTAENKSRRGALLRMRAEVAWLEHDAVAARDDALTARGLMASRPDMPTRLALDGLVALACARAPAPACTADIDADLAASLQRNAANPHPRMLLAWIALARRALDRADTAAARTAIERGIEQVRTELAQDHPLLLAANIWRVIALDAANACADAAQARAGLAKIAATADYPWLAEAQAALAQATHCRRSDSGRSDPQGSSAPAK